MTDAGLILAKHMEADDNKFVNRLLGHGQKRLLLATFANDSGFAKTSIPSRIGATQNVIVLLTDLRLFIIKKKPIRGRYLKFNIPLNSLVEVVIMKRHSGLDLISVSFTDGVNKIARVALVALQALSMELGVLLMTTTGLLQMGRPPQMHVRWHLPDGFIHDKSLFTMPSSWKDALALKYRSHCDIIKTSPVQNVLDSFENGLTIFNPVELLKTSRPRLNDLKALCLAVRNCPSVSSIVVQDAPAIGDEGGAIISKALGPTSRVTSVILGNMGLGRQGIEALCSAFDTHEGPLMLNELNLYRATLNVCSTLLLSNALGNSLANLSKLDLASCGLSTPSFVVLSENLLCRKPCSSSLEYLNLSGNNLGKGGSYALELFLSNTSSLRYLVLIRANIDSNSIVSGLFRNERLTTKVLVGLNLSQNKLERSACSILTEILSRSKSIEDVVLSQARIPADCLSNLLSSAISSHVEDSFNTFRIDISGCNIGSRHALLLFKGTRSPSSTQFRLRCLDVSDCRLGFEGTANVVNAAQSIKSLESLIISNNARTNIFAKGAIHLRDELLNLVKNSTIRHLFIDGDEGPGIPSSVLIPMFEALALTRNLQSLSVCGNRIGEAAFLVLTASIRTNRGLVHLDVDRNGTNLRCLSALAESMRYNDNLCSVRFELDLERVSKQLSPHDCDIITGLIRQRISLNRRRLTGEQNSDSWDIFVSDAKDMRYQRSASTILSSHRQKSSGVNNQDLEDGTSDSAIMTPQFGVDIEECMISPSQIYTPGLPVILTYLQWQVFHYGGLQAEGIFRVAPDSAAQAVLKEKLDAGNFALEKENDNVNVFCMANLIKIWFRSLPNRLLSSISFPRKGECPLNSVLALLSPRNGCVLLWLLDLCAIVVSETAYNKMTPSSLAMVFAPNLVKDVHTCDPLESLQLSQEVAKYMEMWIKERQALNPGTSDLSSTFVDGVDASLGDTVTGDISSSSISFDSNRVDSIALLPYEIPERKRPIPELPSSMNLKEVLTRTPPTLPDRKNEPLPVRTT